jgi:hypothetical protein
MVITARLILEFAGNFIPGESRGSADRQSDRNREYVPLQAHLVENTLVVI